MSTFDHIYLALVTAFIIAGTVLVIIPLFKQDKNNNNEQP